MKTSPALFPNLRLLLVLTVLVWLTFASRMAAQWGHAADVQTPVCAIVGASVSSCQATPPCA